MRAVMGSKAPDVCLEAHDTIKHKLTALNDAPITDPGYDALVQDYMQVWPGLICTLLICVAGSSRSHAAAG